MSRLSPHRIRLRIPQYFPQTGGGRLQFRGIRHTAQSSRRPLFPILACRPPFPSGGPAPHLVSHRIGRSRRNVRRLAPERPGAGDGNSYTSCLPKVVLLVPVLVSIERLIVGEDKSNTPALAAAKPSGKINSHNESKGNRTIRTNQNLVRMPMSVSIGRRTMPNPINPAVIKRPITTRFPGDIVILLQTEFAQQRTNAMVGNRQRLKGGYSNRGRAPDRLAAVGAGIRWWR